jgi:hypothetical protein
VVALELHSDNFAPGGVFDFFIRDALKFRYPMLERLNVGGKLDFTTRLEGAADQWQAQGYLRLRGVFSAAEVAELSEELDYVIENFATLEYKVILIRAMTAAQLPLETVVRPRLPVNVRLTLGPLRRGPDPIRTPCRNGETPSGRT